MGFNIKALDLCVCLFF